ncbi:MAG: aminotransferase class I/II-fold pyridoxal phosphate-dependent enzyme, partial [Sedimentisphaerales bacterium]|nr:aminotransferase class I/II-fold pyridoxal phosphate-dependent enzyme [Sedimentisphaerales bacterium]
MDNYKQQIDELAQKGLGRRLSAIKPEGNGYCTWEGERYLNLSSNDYLGLADNMAIQQSFRELLASHPEWLRFGACSSRLLTGNYELYDEVEEVIRRLYNSQAALFFNSGYHANVGILPALTDKNDLILSDKLCHASMIDGIRLSQATHTRY